MEERTEKSPVCPQEGSLLPKLQDLSPLRRALKAPSCDRGLEACGRKGDGLQGNRPSHIDAFDGEPGVIRRASSESKPPYGDNVPGSSHTETDALLLDGSKRESGGGGPVAYATKFPLYAPRNHPKECRLAHSRRLVIPCSRLP